MIAQRLTVVQKDVLDRLRDGWWIGQPWMDAYELRKTGEPSRHVASVTVESLIRRGLIVDTGIVRVNWTLAS